MGKPAVAADVVVGSIAAELASKVAVHPLDTLKTRLQYLVLPRSSSASKSIPLLGDIRVGFQILAAATRSPHHSMIEPGFSPKVPRHRLALNAARSLYRGLVPQMVGVLPIALVYMPTYEFASAGVKGTYLEHTPVAGLATGVASATVRVPVSVVKSRIQLGLHLSMREAVVRAMRQGESGGLYAGFRATVVLDSSYACVQFFFLEQLRGLALRTSTAPPGGSRPTSPTQLGTGVNAAIGFFTGVCAAILTEPIDVVRTRLMTQGKNPNFQYDGLLHGLRKAVRREGLSSLWKGLLPRLLTKSMGSVIWYTTYMEARHWYTRTAGEPQRRGRT